jgi:hypothetical protein
MQTVHHHHLTVCNVAIVGGIISFSCCCIDHTLVSSSWGFFFFLGCRVLLALPLLQELSLLPRLLQLHLQNLKPGF